MAGVKGKGRGGAGITRRDLVHGLGAGGALLAFGGGISACADQGSQHRVYPPARTGLRGAHPGSYEAAHAIVRGTQPIALPARVDEEYDLIVVGAGLSGLAAAYFYRQRFGDGSRILLLDNHDDFGGHARRNEFHQGDTLRVAIGGSQYLAHWRFSEVVKELMHDLGVDFEQLKVRSAFASGRGGRQGPAIWFDEASFGVNRLVGACDLSGTAFSDSVAAIDSFPIGRESRARLKAFYQARRDVLGHLDARAAKRYMKATPYNAFLREHGGLNDEAIALFQRSSHVFWGVNMSTLSLEEALLNHSPGLHLLGRNVISRAPLSDQGYFPDGNASIARLLVQRLIPQVAPGATAENIATADFDYAQLDQQSWDVRLRLSATGLNVRKNADDIDVGYSVGGGLKVARARHCVLACNHSMIPFLCPDMPEDQKEAQRYQVKAPLLLTNVLLRTGEAMKRLGIDGAYCPGRMHADVYQLGGINSGGYEAPAAGGGPSVLTLSGTIAAPEDIADVREGFRLSRNKMLELTFEDYETEVQTVLDGMLGPAGFDWERDVLAITVNRWPHGYAYEYRDLYDHFQPGDMLPHLIARRPWGNVTIANADAGASAYLHSAIDQAHRAVTELRAS